MDNKRPSLPYFVFGTKFWYTDQENYKGILAELPNGTLFNSRGEIFSGQINRDEFLYAVQTEYNRAFMRNHYLDQKARTLDMNG